MCFKYLFWQNLQLFLCDYKTKHMLLLKIQPRAPYKMIKNNLGDQLKDNIFIIHQQHWKYKCSQKINVCIFLQETHLKKDAHNKLRCGWVNQVYHSTFSAQARGVAILIKKGVPFRQTSTIADTNGRYILVTGEMHSTPITLLNIYGPNYDDSEFFRKIFCLIPDTTNANLIIGGDFNLVLDPYLNKSLSRKITLYKGSSFIKTYMENMNLCDVW